MQANAQTVGPGAGTQNQWGPWSIRSLLFMPVNQDRFVAKAHTRGADAIILDLEDSVAMREKPTARHLIPAAAASIAAHGIDIVVRINSPIRMSIPDLEAVVCPAVNGIWLPKAESASHVQMIAETIAELEVERGMAPGTTWLGVLVETAGAFFRMSEIAASHPAVRTLGLGSEDFALSLGVEPSLETLLYPKQHAVIAARAAGIAALGLIGSVVDFSDLDGMRHIVRQSRRFGFQGSAVIHPSLVPILNEEFRPLAEEVDRARRISEAFNEAIKQGKASIQVDGKMVDYPVAYRAERVLERDALIRERKKRTGRA